MSDGSIFTPAVFAGIESRLRLSRLPVAAAESLRVNQSFGQGNRHSDVSRKSQRSAFSVLTSAVAARLHGPRSIRSSAFWMTAFFDPWRNPAARSSRPPQADRRLRPSSVSRRPTRLDPRLRNATTRVSATRCHFFARTPVSRTVAVTRTRPFFVDFTTTGTVPARRSRSWLVLPSFTVSDFFFAASAAAGASSATNAVSTQMRASNLMRVEPPRSPWRGMYLARGTRRATTLRPMASRDTTALIDHFRSPDAARPALVGREREVAELIAALDAAAGGQGGSFVIAGEPGIGKTRVADALCDAARARGARVAWGRCWEAGGAPPYWPWVQVVRALVEDLDADALARALGPQAAGVLALAPELRERLADPPPAAPARDGESARFAA